MLIFTRHQFGYESKLAHHLFGDMPKIGTLLKFKKIIIFVCFCLTLSESIQFFFSQAEPAVGDSVGEYTEVLALDSIIFVVRAIQAQLGVALLREQALLAPLGENVPK